MSKHETQCQICHAPMTVDIEPNPMFDTEKLLKSATCDGCYQRYTKTVMPVEASNIPPAPDLSQIKMPYADQ